MIADFSKQPWLQLIYCTIYVSLGHNFRYWNRVQQSSNRKKCVNLTPDFSVDDDENKTLGNSSSIDTT